MIMRSKRSRFPAIFAGLAICCLANDPVFAAIGEAAPPERSMARIIPVPQEAQFLDQRIPLKTGVAIVCSQLDVPVLQTGAREIAARLAELGVPAGIGPAASAADTLDLMIVLGTPDGSAQVKEIATEQGIEISVDKPGPQGYVIRFLDQQPATVLLAGSDAPGALYACITFRQLLKGEKGRAYVGAANVRDWPGLRWRVIGSIPPPEDAIRKAKSAAEVRPAYAAYAAAHKRAVDFALRHKINVIPFSGGGLALWTYTPGLGPVARQAMKEIVEYGRQRGVQFSGQGYTGIDVVDLGGPGHNLPDIPKMYSSARTRFSWSHDDLIREQARGYGELAREMGFAAYFLHTADNTNAKDFESWSMRSAQCKARWRDDQRAEAGAHVMGIFREEIQKQNPSTIITAGYVPYNSSYLGSREDRQPVLNYWSRMNELTPPDVAVCMISGSRENLAVARQSYDQHPMFWYYESVPYRGGVQPFFATTPRYIKMFDFGDPRDLFHLAHGMDWKGADRAFCANYAWNSHAPGAALMPDAKHDPYTDAVAPKETAEDLLDGLMVQWFGEDLGPVVAKAARLDLHLDFAVDPDTIFKELARRSRLPAASYKRLGDGAELLRHEVAASRQGLEMLLKVWEQRQSAQIQMAPWQRDELEFMIVYYSAAQAVSTVQVPRQAMEKALKAGDQAAAEQASKAGQAAADAALKLLAGVKEKLGSWNATAKGGNAVKVVTDLKTLLAAMKPKEQKELIPESRRLPAN